MKKYNLKVYENNCLEDNDKIELTTINQLEKYLKSKGYKLGYINFDNNTLVVTKYNRFSQR